MEYLRTLGSAAVSSLVQKSGLNLPFSLGPKVTNLDGICNLYDATKRDDGSLVSVFEYDFSDQGQKIIKQFATNALRKLRATRHPDVLKFMDGVETDTCIYIMTERVRPLPNVLQAWSSRDTKERENWLLWGLHRISVALTFVNDPCYSTHGKICLNSVFISPSGEWKLGGFELFSNPKEDSPILYEFGGLFPGSSCWETPEIKKGGWSILKEQEPSVADAYAMGLLLHAIFNPSHPIPATAHPPHPPPAASSMGAIPMTLFPHFKRLLNPNPKGRLTPKGFLEIGMADTGFFANNRLVKVCLGLDNFTLSSEAEKISFLRTLKESSSSFPPEFTSNRILPSLLTSLEFGGASAAGILPLVFKFGSNLSPEDYPNVILAPLIKLYASPDRGTRMALLDHLPEYVDKLDKKIVSEKIFPNLSTGFSDTVAVIREATTKSIILLAPKLTERILNNDLLRFLAKMQMDPEASIRTNTCILIGRLGPTLGYHTKKKVLVPAFSRALKDTFVHARVAGIMAFMATIDCFEVEDIANKVIPNIAFAMIDKEKLVRDQAFKAVELFVKKLERHATTMPETISSDATENPGPTPGTMPEQITLVTSAAGAAGSLAGWAISSLGKKLITSDLQTSIGVGLGGPIERPTSPLPPVGNTFSNAPMSSPASPTTSAQSSSPKAKGMQLGASKRPTAIAATIIAEQWAEDDSTGNENPWGTDDLIDVNADQDDWSAFETAPLSKLNPTGLGLGINSNANLNDSPHRSSSSTLAIKGNSVSRAPTPLSLTAQSDSASNESWGATRKSISPVPTTPRPSEMTKEEKAAEMARRKEERKQRIALLKEQKKNSGRS